MGFTRHLLPAWKRQLNERSANATILKAIDIELKEAEQDAIEGKSVLSLSTSTGKWLDMFGDIFGVIRQDNETDDDYRDRIVRYVNIERGTIPAIIESIRDYLDDYESRIEVYEPYNNIFTLNKSRLNGPDHFLGDYYRVAVIDVRFSRTIPLDMLLLLEGFKPAGVRIWLSYMPNAYNPEAETVKMPLSGSIIKQPQQRLHIFNGIHDRIRGHVNLTNRVREVEDESGIFILNKSKLNSLDRLAGSFTVSNANFNLATYSQENLVFDTRTTTSDVLNQTENVLSEDFYIRTGAVNDLYASHTVSENHTHYFYFTLDLATYFDLFYPAHLREVEPSGVYTKDTWLKLIDSPYIQYDLSTTNSDARPAAYRLQALDVVNRKWVTLTDSTAGISRKNDIIKLDNFNNFLSEIGCVFIRTVLNPIDMYDGGTFTNNRFQKKLDGGYFHHNIIDEGSDTNVLDGLFRSQDYIIRVDGNYKSGSPTAYYDFRLYYLELGFTKEFAVRPTIKVLKGNTTNEHVLYTIN